MIRLAMLLRCSVMGILVLFLLQPQMFAPLLSRLNRNNAPAIYDKDSLLALTISHLLIVGAATAVSALIAVGAAVWVTRPAGKAFLPLAKSIANMAQVFPPVAVLALTIPVAGFGNSPILIALFLYGLLPVFQNTLAALMGIPKTVLMAASGSGMTSWQRLWGVELPLSLPLILAGVRISLVTGLSTATIGSTVAAKTLGEVIIAGLLSNNLAYVVQGGAVVAVLAMLLYDGLLILERRVCR